MSAKVYINARCLEYKMSGIERYCYKLLEVNNIDYILLSKNPLPDYKLNHENIFSDSPEKKSDSSFSKLFWEAFRVGRLIKNENNTIYHSVNTVLPFSLPSKIKAIVTVHDFAYKVFPKCFTFKEKLFYRIFNYWSFLRANKIICISESTFNDLARFYPRFKNKAVVVYNGFENFSGSVESFSSTLSSMRLEENEFYLVVGTLNKRKNLVRLIDTFKKLYQEKKTTKKLVIVGDSNKLNYLLEDDRIIVTDYITDSVLSCLYQGCFSYLFPSLYEGFGFPILEAQAFGKPIMTSDRSSTKEISGYPVDDLINPESLASMENFLIKLENDKSFYERLSELSLKNFKNYSWNKMQDDTLEVYKSVLV